MTQGNGTSTSSHTGGRIDDVSATFVTLDRSAAGNVEAQQAQLERAAVRRLQAQQATIEKSAIAFAHIDQATLRESQAAIVVARSVACDESRTFILASPIVRGEVHALIDMRSAVAIGVGMVLGKVMIGAVRALARRVTA